ncbi:MAG: hypothetical protein AAFU85_33100 [Planctomycetota bacterium]
MSYFKKLFCRLGRFAVIVVFSVDAGFSVDARAQSPMPSGPGLHIFKSASVDVAATHVRMIGRIEVINSDARRALETLRELKEKAKQKLIQLKADQSTIVFSETTLGASNVDDDDVEMMMMEMGMDTSSDEAPSLPLAAQATVQVDWSIPESDNDAKILFIRRLQEKIEQVDVIGGQEGQNLTDEQAEMMEQMSQMQRQYGGSGSGAKLKLQFVGKVTPGQKRAAMKTATQQATEDADAMANALGVKRGAVRSVAATPSLGAQFGYGRRPGISVPTAPNEVTSENPSKLEYTINLVTTFEIVRDE